MIFMRFVTLSEGEGSPLTKRMTPISATGHRNDIWKDPRIQDGGDLMEVYQLGLKRTTTMSPS